MTAQTWKHITAALLGATVFILGVYDIFAEIFGGDSTTISQIILHMSQAVPIIAVAFGVLIGHLFWPQQKTQLPFFIIKQPQAGEGHAPETMHK